MVIREDYIYIKKAFSENTLAFSYKYWLVFRKYDCIIEAMFTKLSVFLFLNYQLRAKLMQLEQLFRYNLLFCLNVFDENFCL